MDKNAQNSDGESCENPGRAGPSGDSRSADRLRQEADYWRAMATGSPGWSLTPPYGHRTSSRMAANLSASAGDRPEMPYLRRYDARDEREELRTTLREIVHELSGVGRTSPKKQLRLETFNGETDWCDYEHHLAIISHANGWSDEEAGLQLASHLTGSARSVLRGLGPEDCTDLASIRRRLRAKYDSPALREKFKSELRQCCRESGTSLVHYADKVERLVDCAYPGLPEEARQSFAVDAFVRGLPVGNLRVHTRLSARLRRRSGRLRRRSARLR